MECTWFFGGDLRTSAILISLLGIVHPVFWVVAARRYRSEWFLALYVLSGAWSLVSCLLLAGVLAKLEVLYWIWIWFSLVFVPVMVIGMVLMSIGFVVLRMPRVALCPVLGLVYYILTIYCICVVDTQRRDALRGRTAERAAERSVTKVLREALPAPQTNSTALLTPSTNSTRRGFCSVPERNPNNGVYMAALPNNQVAQPGRAYPRLRLWVYCDKFYRPRSLQYAFCYSGGWNLPLPDCVKDASYYEEYYYDSSDSTTTTEKPKECVVPRPPAHGFFMRDAKVTRRYMQLSVRCNTMHFLVGWQRITCYDGVWDRPVPNCAFMDTAVCTLLGSDAKLIRTCLAGALYAGSYRCDRGVVPHGAVVEPRCPQHYYVWGPFSYLFCVNGIWHPQLLANVTCEYAADIYSHYEIEDLKNKTSTAIAASAHDVREQDSVRHADTGDSAARVATQTLRDTQRSETRLLSRTNVTKTTRRASSSSRKTDIWKAQNKTGGFLTSNTAKTNIWASQGDTSESSDFLNMTSNKNITSRMPTTRRISTSSRKIDITDIWKDQIDGEETLSAISTESNIWRPLPEEALIDNLLKADKESEIGAEWPSRRDREWFSADAIPSIQNTESDDDAIKLSTRNSRNKDEGFSSTSTTEASIWKFRENGGESAQTGLWKSDTDELRTLSNRMSSSPQNTSASGWAFIRTLGPEGVTHSRRALSNTTKKQVMRI